MTDREVMRLGPASLEEARERVYRRCFWRIVPFLMLCYIVSYLDRVNIGFAKLQMLTEVNFSETVFGFGSGIFFLGYFLFGLPSNIMLRRFGARRWIAGIMLAWGLISALFVTVSSVHGFYLLRFLLGIAEAGFYPGIIFYLTCWFPVHWRARIIALFMSAIPISSIFGNPLSGWLMDYLNGAAGLSGWKWMFLIEAVPALLLGCGLLFYLDDRIDEARWLSPAERRLASDGVAANPNARPDKKGGLFAALADRTVWRMALLYFCIILGQYGLNFWMPSLVKAIGFTSNLKVGLVSAIPALATLILMNVLASSADRRRERKWHLALTAFAGAFGFVAAGFLTSPFLSIAALSLAAAGAISCAPLFWPLPTALLARDGMALGIAVVNSVGNLAGFVAPYAIGYAKDQTGSPALGLYLIAGGLALGGFLALSVPARSLDR